MCMGVCACISYTGDSFPHLRPIRMGRLPLPGRNHRLSAFLLASSILNFAFQSPLVVLVEICFAKISENARRQYAVKSRIPVPSLHVLYSSQFHKPSK